MNQTTLVGRLCRNVVVRQVGEHRVVDNCIAVARRKRNKQGELPTDFIPIVAWDGLADILVNYCQKGQQIAVQGKLQSRSYLNSKQQTVHLVECCVNEVTLIQSKSKGEPLPTESLAEVDLGLEDMAEVV